MIASAPQDGTTSASQIVPISLKGSSNESTRTSSVSQVHKDDRHDFMGEEESLNAFLSSMDDAVATVTITRRWPTSRRLGRSLLMLWLVLLLLQTPPDIDAFPCAGTRVVAEQRTSLLVSTLRVASIHSQPQDDSDGVTGPAQTMVAETVKTSVSQRLTTKTTSTTTAIATSSDASAIAATASKYASLVDFDWQSVAEQVFVNDQRPIILFDGVCNLCNGGVNFAIDHDRHAKFRFASLQSRVAQSLLLREGKHPTETQNIVLVTPRTAYYKSHAVAKICSQLDLPPLRWMGKVGQVLPKALREPVYKFVSRNRFVLGENDSCRLDFDGVYTNRFVSDPTIVGPRVVVDATTVEQTGNE